LQANGLVLAPTTARGAETDPIYRWLKNWEQRRATFERGRQLYVAATRARRNLHLLGSVGVGTNKDGVHPKRPKAGSLLALLWPSIADRFATTLHETAGNAAAESSSRAPMVLRRLPLHWQAAQSPAVAFTGPIETVMTAVEQPEFDWVGETGRHVGTVVHRELERLSQAVLQPAHWTADRRRMQFAAELAELGVPERYRAEASQRAADAVAATLNDERGRWILGLAGTHREAYSELALSGVIAGAVRNVVIDRSFLDTDGTRWIVDFKTSLHAGGGLESFLDSEVERYRPQLQQYAKLMHGFRPEQPIRAALYFPLLKAWREVI